MTVNYYLDNDGNLVALCTDCARRRPMEYRDGPGLACEGCGYEEPFPDPLADKPLSPGERAWGIDGF